MSNIPSDLPGPVDLPTGPTEGAAVIAPAAPEADSAILAPASESPGSVVNAPEITPPAPVAASGEVILTLDAPWFVQNFNPSVVGCPVVSRSGTPVPSQFADQVISIGAANGVTIVKR